MGDLTIIILSITMVIMCWAMIRINDKLNRYISRFKRLENALVKNSTNKVATPMNQTGKAVQRTSTSINTEAPMANTADDIRPQGLNFIAKK